MFDAARQRYFSVDRLKERLENGESENILLSVKDNVLSSSICAILYWLYSSDFFPVILSFLINT